MDYQTNTSLTVTGDNTVVKTTTVKHVNDDIVAFNSFERFDVYEGKVVNLV